jgi:cytochrome c peroxidase
MPKNPENPFNNDLAHNPEGSTWIDTRLGGLLETVQPETASQELGKMKVPKLRNVDKHPSASFVRAYRHNGYLKLDHHKSHNVPALWLFASRAI